MPGDGSQPQNRLGDFDAMFRPFMVLLGLVFLILVVIDFSGLPLTPTEQRWVRAGELAIYATFVGEFVIRLALASKKAEFLRGTWFDLLSLALPLLRPLIVLRAVPMLATGQGLAAIGGAHRGLAALRTVTRGRQLAYVVAVTATVVMLSSGLVLYFEQRESASPLHSFGESLWWAATLVTTINSSNDPLSAPGRVVAVLLRIYALSIFGYITASIATWFIGAQGHLRSASSRDTTGSGVQVSPNRDE